MPQAFPIRWLILFQETAAPTFEDLSFESDVWEMRVIRQEEAADQGLGEGREDRLEQGLCDAAVHLTDGADHVGLDASKFR